MTGHDKAGGNGSQIFSQRLAEYFVGKATAFDWPFSSSSGASFRFQFNQFLIWTAKLSLQVKSYAYGKLHPQLNTGSHNNELGQILSELGNVDTNIANRGIVHAFYIGNRIAKRVCTYVCAHKFHVLLENGIGVYV